MAGSSFVVELHRGRDRRGRRHLLASVLAVSAAAVLAGARSVVAIAEWAHWTNPASGFSPGCCGAGKMAPGTRDTRQ